MSKVFSLTIRMEQRAPEEPGSLSPTNNKEGSLTKVWVLENLVHRSDAEAGAEWLRRQKGFQSVQPFKYETAFGEWVIASPSEAEYKKYRRIRNSFVPRVDLERGEFVQDWPWRKK